jgi:hypothetical protein
MCFFRKAKSLKAGLSGRAVRIPPVAWISVSFKYCVLSGRDVQRSPSGCGVSDCDHESSIIRPWPTGGGGVLLRHDKSLP